MEQNVDSAERVPRIVMALASAIGAAVAPSAAIKGVLVVVAGGILATVATGYCPLNTLVGRGMATEPKWRTIKTWRVEA